MAKSKGGGDVSKSWFCVLNNPEDHGFNGTEEEQVKQLISIWISSSNDNNGEKRSIAAAFCLSGSGLKHIHFVAESNKAMRFSKVKSLFPTAHIEETQGNKNQVIDYIEKKGVFQEKGEIILYKEFYGDVKGNQGRRSDLLAIEALINDGKTPREIFRESFSYRRYEKMIKDAYYQKRLDETPIIRDVKVIYHLGASGSGKSYTLTSLKEDDTYIYTDYEGGGLDGYNGEHILFMDEFRGQIKYNTLLVMLQGYKMPLHARYTNAYSLWDEVHITSVIPPEKIYQKMIKENEREIDTFLQLRRRISEIWYHYKTEDGKYKIYKLSMNDYMDYEELLKRVEDYEKKEEADKAIDLFTFLEITTS